MTKKIVYFIIFLIIFIILSVGTYFIIPIDTKQKWIQCKLFR